jgi:Family of unknown function (DUF6010)
MLFTDLLFEKLSTLGLLNWIAPVIIGLLYITLNSFSKEPARQKFNAVMIAGAGAAYLSGGFGAWEFAFATVLTFCAYHGLRDYRYIGVAWLLHTCWDFAHYLYGNPIIPFAATSSFGCAICDPIIAAWCFMGAPSVFGALRRLRGLSRPSGA